MSQVAKWQNDWDRAVAAFVEQHDGMVTEDLADLLYKCAELVPTTVRGMYCVPGIIFQGSPPSFSEILEMAKAGKEIPIVGITEGQVQVLAGG